jgi:FixJ family two-component response regulator
LSQDEQSIAVVDDDESVRRALARLLRAAGFDAVVFPSGEALLGSGRHARFPCVVLDIRLGGMSGLEVAHVLTTTKPRVEVIMMTAEDTPENRDEATRLGCIAYFAKPFDGQEMVHAIRLATAIRDGAQ